ncbi:hypothetical protein CesoFtcFv8_025556 [Champsocephalus esox]|uniref:Uncharacterized protein n=1 Tax=Champsocephalus esox TaxID=159716 RepID=A0AAN8B4Q2_9TELE|nr:hypothetical protein CesoFtcFv8_025556 [Champsocephalus esox]
MNTLPEVKVILFWQFDTIGRQLSKSFRESLSPGSHFTEFRFALPCLRWLLCCEHTKVMLPKSCLSPSEKEKG